LVPGLYVYACSPHFQTMFGRLQVVGAPTPEGPPQPLRASVTAKTSVLRASSVTSGPYRLSVTDSSRTRNFHIVGPGVNRRTTKAFVGKVTWNLRLKRGTYRYGNDPRLTGRLFVA